MRTNALLNFRNKRIHCRERRKSQRGERRELSAVRRGRLWPWGRARVPRRFWRPRWRKAHPGLAPPWQALSRHAQAARVPLFSVTDPQPFYKQVILVTKDAARAGRKVRERRRAGGNTSRLAVLSWGDRSGLGGRHVGRRGGSEAPCVSLARDGGREGPRTVRGAAGPGSPGRPQSCCACGSRPKTPREEEGRSRAVHGIRFKGKRLTVLPCCTGEPETHVLISI